MSKLKTEEENIESMDIDQKLILAIKEPACTLSDIRIEEYNLPFCRKCFTSGHIWNYS